MKRLLWIGDAGCDSGFARATHHILEALRHEFNVSVLGVNYRGDPHTYPYPIYPARNIALQHGGDILGASRLGEILSRVEPDVIVIQNDPWHVENYMRPLRAHNYVGKVIGAIAIDGKNCAYGDDMNALDLTVFWTRFARDEARLGGYRKPAVVIPLGVDRRIYYPGDRVAARHTLKMPEVLDDAFIFLNVNRNQPRKRIDLTMRYFGLWLAAHPEAINAYLMLHVCPTGDVGVNIAQLAKYYGINGRVVTSVPGVYKGVTEDQLATIYRACNVQVSTTQGEGFGLTTLEGMACGLPQIFPEWSALEELFGAAAYMVECTSVSLTTPVNVIGGVADEDTFIAALDDLYRNRDTYDAYQKMSLQRAADPYFDWEGIGAKWVRIVQHVVGV